MYPRFSCLVRIMNDIQQYAPYEADFGVMVMQSDGAFVTYADHVEALEDMKVRAYNDGRLYEGGLNVAALRQAEQRGREQIRASCRDHYAVGQRDALAVIEAARDKMPDTTIRRELDRVIRAIKGDSDE